MDAAQAKSASRPPSAPSAAAAATAAALPPPRHGSSSSSPTTPMPHGAALTAGKVRVIVRCRPPLSNEASHSWNRVHVSGESIVVQDDSPASGNEAKKFGFDRVLSPEADQADAFAEVAPLIDHVLDGFHATVFAYGQTGSGKTFTMEGLNYVPSGKVNGGMIPDTQGTPPDHHGVLLRAIQLLYDRARERQGGTRRKSGGSEGEEEGVPVDPVSAAYNELEQYSFKCSYLQIYNEKITDLLNAFSAKESKKIFGATSAAKENPGLPIRWCHGDVFKVQNLVKWECDGPQSMREALFRGVKEKVVASHFLNTQSSRSHCIFTIYVECRNLKTDTIIRSSEFAFVDLAGSEKISMLAANPSAKLVRESININTSLLALGKVITALADNSGGGKGKKGTAAAGAGRRKFVHVPYRDSKLTKLLKHALGGNSFTIMVACINLSDLYVEETMSTLLYAGRAKNIENVPYINEDPTASLIRSLRNEIAQLKKEVEYYRAMASAYISQKTREAIDPSTATAPSAAGAGTNSTNGQATAAVGTAPSTGVTSSRALTPQQADQLADSLLSACEMLQQVMGVNGKLREAFDTVQAAREAAEEREVQLNAENIALRERIELLESIALNKDFVQEEDEDTGSQALDKDNNNDSDDNSEEEEDNDKRPTWSQGSAGKGKSLPPQPPPSNPKRENVQTKEEAPIHLGGKTNERQTPRSGAPAALPPGPPAPSATTASPRAVEAPPPPKQKRTVSSNHTGAAKKKTRSKKTRKLRKRLDEYESRYRGSGAAASGDDYEAYYGKAMQQVPNDAKAAAAAKDVKALLDSLPRDIIQNFVPQSALKTKAYGKLSFCGPDDVVQELERKRREREAYRDRLLQRQAELRENITKNILLSEMGGETYVQHVAAANLNQPNPTEMTAAQLFSPYGAAAAPNSSRGGQQPSRPAPLPQEVPHPYNSSSATTQARGGGGTGLPPPAGAASPGVAASAAIFSSSFPRSGPRSNAAGISANGESQSSSGRSGVQDSVRASSGGGSSSMERLRNYLQQQQQKQ